MAVILPGAGVADIRGSAGGVTFARNRSGNYMPNRTKPVNPDSAAQRLVRSVMATLSTRWREHLTVSERQAWNSYADATTWTNALGQSIKLSGQAMYVRSESIRMACDNAIVDTAPTTPGIPAQETLWTPTGTADDNIISIAHTFPVNVNGQNYVFYAGIPTSLGRTFYGGPWRFLGTIQGNNGTPPASPSTFNYPWTMGVSQQVYVYVRRIDADERVSEPFLKSFTPTAS